MAASAARVEESEQQTKCRSGADFTSHTLLPFGNDREGDEARHILQPSISRFGDSRTRYHGELQLRVGSPLKDVDLAPLCT